MWTVDGFESESRAVARTVGKDAGGSQIASLPTRRPRRPRPRPRPRPPSLLNWPVLPTHLCLFGASNHVSPPIPSNNPTEGDVFPGTHRSLSCS